MCDLDRNDVLMDFFIVGFGFFGFIIVEWVVVVGWKVMIFE